MFCMSLLLSRRHTNPCLSYITCTLESLMLMRNNLSCMVGNFLHLIFRVTTNLRDILYSLLMAGWFQLFLRDIVPSFCNGHRCNQLRENHLKWLLLSILLLRQCFLWQVRYSSIHLDFFATILGGMDHTWRLCLDCTFRVST